MIGGDYFGERFVGNYLQIDDKISVIGGEYFGERFVGNYFQIDDNITVSDWWRIFW